MTTRYELNAPLRMWETWEWVNAFCAYDHGDPKPLSELIQTEYIPQEYRTAVGDIITGNRKPKKKGKRKFPAGIMMFCARDVDITLGAIDVYRHGDFIQELAENNKKEVGEVVFLVRKESRDYLKKVADSYNVSTETIEDLMREMRTRINRWPIV